MTPQSPPARTAPALGYLAALGLVIFATAAALGLERYVGVPNLSLMFVLPVVAAAAGFGWGPALTASVAGVLAFNFFLLEPRYTLRIDDPANVWGLGLLLACAAIVSAVAAQGRGRALAARRHADQALALQALARSLVGARDRDAILAAAVEALARLFSAPAVAACETAEGLGTPIVTGAGPLDDADREAARWALAARLPTRAGTYPVDKASYDFWPVGASGQPRVAIGVRFPPDGRPDDLDPLIEIVGGHLSVALARDDYARQVLETRVEVEGERLKSDLLAAVSHDLKTPLSTILLTLQNLQRFPRAHSAEARRELLALAEAETARLNDLVSNLLDMSRLDAGAVVVAPARTTAADLIAGARERAAAALEGHDVVVDIAEPAPSLVIDRGLAETALANILQNAGKYAPAGSAIAVRVTTAGQEALIEVNDRGPGFPGPVEPLFEKFTRGVQGDGRPPGTGLGLAIARGFAAAQGGRVEADNRPADHPDGAGARVRLFLPVV